MRTFFINLDRRPDRREKIMTELARMGHDAVRIPAIDGKKWDGQGWRKQSTSREHIWRGGAGCYFSHILALQTAIEQNIFPCLIVEDDVVFTSAVPIVRPYRMCLLGGSYVPGKGTYLTHAIAYADAEIAQQFLTRLQLSKTTTDGTCVKFQKQCPDLCGVLTPYIAFQRDDYSDIQCVTVSRVVQ